MPFQGLEGTVEKYCAALGKDAHYSKKSSVSRLPAYLTIQFVRFFVGKAVDSEGVVSKKILKVNRSILLQTFKVVSTAGCEISNETRRL